MKKVLLTSVCRPLGPKQGDASSVGYELLFGQVTRAQGIFSPRAVHHHFSLEYIAANIQAPTVVLQYPSRRELIRELKKGYDYVGVSFILATFHHMKSLSALIRKHAPQSKIVLGGYGAVLGEEALKPYADHICRGEGVEFFRALLEEKHGSKQYKHPLIVSKLRMFSKHVSNTGMIFAGLGCPNGCDFCSTSHFFRRQHIKLLNTGRDIFNVIERYLDMDPHMSFTVIDEDFLLNKERALEFRDAVIKSGKPLSIFAFASVKALSQYRISELIEMGIDGVWIGYEGTRSGYEKQQGRPVAELFQELREHGITILSSMIVGFDYQDSEVVRAEHDGLMKLKPSLAQFMIYGPIPGTPFYDRVMSEGRLREDLVSQPETFYRKCTGFTAMVKHPKLSAAQIEDLQSWCFSEDYRRLGPSVFRIAETWLLGYQKLKAAANPILARKAQSIARDLRKVYPIFITGRLFGPNARIRSWIGELEQRVYAELGAPTWKERLESAAAIGAAVWTWAALQLDIGQHPRLQRTVHRMPGSSWVDHRVWEGLAARWKAADLRLNVEFLHTRKQVWLRFEGRMNQRSTEALWQDMCNSLERCKGRIILDFKRLHWEGGQMSPEMRQKLAEYRSRVSLVLPKLQHAHPEILILANMFRHYKDGFGL
ncbi:MAG: cobalamin-dependent protein [Elusimicrobiota bacterium]|jgi:hypothetical protein